MGREALVLAVVISIANHSPRMGGANPKPLAAALSREVEKVNKYAADSRELNLNFHPLVLDAYGGIPPSTVHHVLNPLINRVKNFVSLNWAAPSAKAYWYQRLSVTLWTFNAYKVKPQSGIY